jgi:hypothetical protein
MTANPVVFNNGRDEVVVSATNPLPVSASSGFAASATFTPAAAAYSAGDIFESAKEFTFMGPSARNIRITGVEFEVDHTALIASEAAYRLYLYSVTPPSALADNAAWDLPSGDRASFLGYVDLGTPVDLGSTLYVQTINVNKEVKLAGTSLFGYLVTIAGFTPTAAARKVTLHTTTL